MILGKVRGGGAGGQEAAGGGKAQHTRRRGFLLPEKMAWISSGTEPLAESTVLLNSATCSAGQTVRYQRSEIERWGEV